MTRSRKKWGKISEDIQRFKQYCDAGLLRWCIDLGIIEADTGDLPGAQKHFKQACFGGVAIGCTILAKHIDANLSEQRRPYQKACDGGESMACTELGFIFQNEKKIPQARLFYKKACDGGVKKACELLMSTNTNHLK